MRKCEMCSGEVVTEGGKSACIKCGLIPYREELTEAGPQYVMPGCERIAPDNGKPHQLGLF